MKNRSLPRVMIAAPKSGSGKTSLVCGLLNLMKTKGLDVVSFKCGPDYIDPMFHRRVLQVPSYNLDTFFTGRDGTLSLFEKHAGAVSVIEGVMGYFDGLGGTEFTASSYDLAVTTQTPVILVVDVKGMSRSAVPLLKGFLAYGDQAMIKGVILNRISPMMYPMMKALIENELPIRVLGYVPVTENADWGSRHLGLVQADEIKDFKAQIDGLSQELEKSLDFDGIMAIAAATPELPAVNGGGNDCSDNRGSGNPCGENDDNDDCCTENPSGENCHGETHGGGNFESNTVVGMAAEKPRVCIGVARDEAFTFYYEDNLDILRDLGADIVAFSPLRDASLPDVDGLLLGGGYPELHAEELEKNETMKASLREAADKGMPILAECGGFMYLQEGLMLDDRSYRMAGVLKGNTRMKNRLVRFGYVTITAHDKGDGTSQCPYLSLGETIKAHEFHYFDSDDNGSACRAQKPTGSRSWDCIVVKNGVMAGYPHLYYASNPAVAEAFIEACRCRKTM